MGNLIYPPQTAKRQRGSEVRVTRSMARKTCKRAILGLDMVGGACSGRTFNDITARGILPSGDVVYLVSYIVGTKNTEERWEYADRGNFFVFFIFWCSILIFVIEFNQVMVAGAVLSSCSGYQSLQRKKRYLPLFYGREGVNEVVYRLIEGEARSIWFVFDYTSVTDMFP